MKNSVLFAVVAVAGTAVSAMAQATGSVSTKWEVVGSVGTSGATAITLVLKAKANVGGTLPTAFPDGDPNDPNNTQSIYGNYGVYQVGEATGAVKADVSVTGAPLTVLRGKWASPTNRTQQFSISAAGTDYVSGNVARTITGAAPSGASGLVTGASGFRGLMGGNDQELISQFDNNAARVNGHQNGQTAADFKSITAIDLLRFSSISGTIDQDTGLYVLPSTTFNQDVNGFQDIYRVEVRSTNPIVIDPNGSYSLDGKLNYKILIGLKINSNTGAWGAANDGIIDVGRLTTTIKFSEVPTPGTAALAGLAGLVAARRRR